MGEPLVLALDIATQTGWALGPVPAAPVTPLEVAAGALASTPESGTRSFDGKGGQFFNNFAGWVGAMLTRHEPAFLIYEAPVLPARTQIATLRRLYGMVAVVEVVARCWPETQVFEVPLQLIKKHATGNGRAKKSAMIAAAKRMGWKPKDDNEADALWLWDYGCSVVRAAARSEAAA